MFSEPKGPHLTNEQAQELDDRFFQSRPLDYFRSRIGALLMPGAPAPDLEQGAGREFAEVLGHQDLRDRLAVGLGRTYAGTYVRLLVQDLDIRIVDTATGELLRELVLDPTRDYQPTGQSPGPTSKTSNGPTFP